jgi:hypothetical protein
MLVSPRVAVGHVAGWVGIGGRAVGPSGSDEWLELGYSSFRDGTTSVFYERASPSTPATYHQVRARVSPGEIHLLTILEVAHQPGSWRAWLDGRPVSPIVRLPGSHRRFRPLAVAESWNAGNGNCNNYDYRFSDLRVAAAPGGSWQQSNIGTRWHDHQNQLRGLTSTSFQACSTADCAGPGAAVELLTARAKPRTHN